MPLRLVLLFALASVLLMGSEEKQVPSCCEPESEKLSQSQVKALVKKTEPIHPPCCADMLHMSGTVVLAISVDPQGNVACVQMVSGHALIIGAVIDSVRQWKFEPYTSKGIKKPFCGQVAIRFQANEYRVKYKNNLGVRARLVAKPVRFPAGFHFDDYGVYQELTSWNDANASLHFTRTSSLKLKDRWPHMLFSVVCARQELVSVLLACCIGGYSASAQQTRPAAKEGYQQALPVHVVSIRLSTFGGTCECCPGDELKVKPGEAMLLLTFSRECHQQDSRRYRDLRVNADLSGKHWQALQRLVDHDALFALPDRIGCASCYDGVDELIEVKFSDHSKKSVTFPMGSAPKEISALSEKLLSLEAKLRDELPIGVKSW